LAATPNNALQTKDISGIVQEHRLAAERAKAAHFDGVEIHAAGGYLLDQFLQNGTNKRNLLGFIYRPHDKDLITYTSYAMILQADNLTSLDKVIKFGLPASFADITNRSIQFRFDMPGMFNPQS